MSGLALLAAQALTLAAFDRLPPATAGERALAGQEHGSVVEVVAQPGNGPPAPGITERGLIERAVASAGGCVRRRWTVRFFGRDDAIPVLDGATAITEVALRRAAVCPGTGYAHVNPVLDAGVAIAALERLEAIRRPGSRVRLTCRDETGSGLCRGDEAGVRRALVRLSPWAVSRSPNDMVEAWLGVPGQAVTAVRFAVTGGAAAVARTFPAPF